MSLTLEDLKDRLKKQDEVSLLEILDISSEEIVERFVDLIEDQFEKLEEELQDEDQELQTD
jgi:hypothetical protein